MSVVRLERPDGSLVREHLHGQDEEAFGVLYRRFWPRLVRFLRSRTGDAALAEDIAQETLLRALTHLDDFDSSRPMWPWLKTIATRLVVDEARKSSREVAHESPQDHERLTDSFDLSDADEMARLIALLPSRQRIALKLRYMNDWDAHSAAGFLGLSRTAYEQLLFRARTKLRIEFERMREASLAGLLPLWRRLNGLSFRAKRSASSAASVPGIDPQVFGQLIAACVAFAVVTSAIPTAPKVQPNATRMSRIAMASGAHPRGAESSHEASGSSSQGDGTGDVGSVSADTSEGESSPNAVDNAVTRITDPNGGVRSPEDATITSIEFTPGTRGTTGYAIGHAVCGTKCTQVLFRTRDGGHTWKRLPAESLVGKTLILPAHSSDKMFAMGPLGLQVSNDGGRSFEWAVTAGSNFAAGDAAVSPAFAAGDPTILIGSQTLLRYRDDEGSVAPVPTTATGPLHPAFAPAYPADQRVLVGGVSTDLGKQGVSSAVFSCRINICNTAVLKGEVESPELRLSPSYAVTGLAYAFTTRAIFATWDGARNFAEITSGWESSFIADVELDRGEIYVATLPSRPGAGDAGLYVWGDSTWTRTTDPLFANGVVDVTIESGRMLASLPGGGVACSTDGESWSRRCEAS